MALATAGCNDWLDLKPNNEQVSDDYWQSKEDVEAVIASGYYYMRTAAPDLLAWGELRGGTVTFVSGTEDRLKMQNFDILPSSSVCDYSKLYQIINMANSVLKNAPGVQTVDETYYTAVLNSHLCEAYFQRAYAYSILVKNWREVPLVLSAYDTDEADFELPKSSEEEIVAQIKADVLAALKTGAAKAYYEEEWQTKGRATKWALYALMADICLWNHDYEECILYCNEILNATDAMRPAFITSTARWYEIFYPGNSNESIFELNWDGGAFGQTNSFQSVFGQEYTSTGYAISQRAQEQMRQETAEVLQQGADANGRVGRMLLATYVCGATASGYNAWQTAPNYFVWKYRGSDVVDVTNVRPNGNDANYILYRVADVMLMKAEALTMSGPASWGAAVRLINQIRVRAGLPPYLAEDDAFEASLESLDELTLLNEVLEQRDMEFVAEGKRWYDVLRLARYDAAFSPQDDLGRGNAPAADKRPMNGYMKEAANLILAGNRTTSPAQLRSVLSNPWAWYLPIPQNDVLTNENMVQNPYYSTAK